MGATVWRAGLLAVLFVVAVHSYLTTKFLIQRKVWYFTFYAGLALASSGILIAPPVPALLLFAGLFLFLLGVGMIVRHLKYFSTRDYLTGLYLRTYFFEEWLPREVSRQRRIGGSIAFAMLDIDDMKKTNDEKGHRAGDELLKEVASVILQNIRKADVAVRFGGDELLLAFPGEREEGAIKALERIRKALPGVSFSFGVSVWDDSRDPEKAIEVADQRMYELKKVKKSNNTSKENSAKFFCIL
ncbi:MAG: hypothetical protein PWP60_289 [Candidatus Atribacteria bacterium]|uniref:GGDEF domain-containing protein n=1 Tax=Atrimonas thermophila TaxID=3064161 RepID=UPI0024AC4B21|nr:hypothetical protein [Candidatus Atribacteria bacterium]MDI3530440.1 hypothetical protein [Candidatus Atribacteria bacterium]